jgi:hypothetical protein
MPHQSVEEEERSEPGGSESLAYDLAQVVEIVRF